MATIVITGGTGLVGSALVNRLLKNEHHSVIILTRNPQEHLNENSYGNRLKYMLWDVKKQIIDKEAIRQADYIIHLAGAGVMDKKWTKEYKDEIVESRVQSSKLLIKTLLEVEHHVKAFISASAIGWYGADKAGQREGFKENAPNDNDFLGETCRLWEESSKTVEQLGIRKVSLRIGIVLSNKGGALLEFMKSFKYGVMAILGSGEQMISWIHINDLCNMYEYAITNDQLRGSYNAVAPCPVSNQTLLTAIAKNKGGKYLPIHVPAFALKLILGKEKSQEILKSTTVLSEKIQAAGFQFQYATIDAALNNLI